MPQAQQQQQQGMQQQNGSQQGQAFPSMQGLAGPRGPETRKRKAEDDDSDLFSLLPSHAPAPTGIPQQASPVMTAVSIYDSAAGRCVLLQAPYSFWCNCTWH